MDKDFKNWPGGYPADASESEAAKLTAQTEENDEPPHAAPHDGYVKQTAKQFDSSASASKLPRPTRWDIAESHARSEQREKSSSVLGSVVSMLTGSSAPTKEPGKAKEEHYQSQLAQKVERLEKQNFQYRGQLQSQKRESDEEYAALVNKANQVISKDRSRHQTEMTRQEQAHGWEMHRLREECASHVESAKKEKKMAEDSCKKFEREFEVMEKKIRDLQSVQLQSVEAVQWAPHSHSDIEHKLKSILARVRQWATEYSFLEIGQVLNPEFFAYLATLLQKQGCITDANLLYDALESNKSMKKPGKAFAVILSAVVSFEIILQTIGDPFCAFVGSSEDKHVLGDRHGRCFRAAVQLIHNYDVSGAEGLRCQLLRLLDPVSTGTAAAEKMKSVARESRGAAAEKIANGIMEQISHTLVEGKARDACISLTALAQEAVDLSWELWTRKAHIKILGWPGLQERTTKPIKYRANAKALEAHPLHNRELEDEPEALDGADIVLLCTPAIIAAGSAEGQDYDKEKLIKKAIVMLG